MTPEAELEAISACLFSRGYASTTLTELSRATGLHRPSLQRTYGNRDQIYCAAVRYYEKKLVRQLELFFLRSFPDQGIEAMLSRAASPHRYREELDFVPLSVIATDACLERSIEECFRQLLKSFQAAIAGPARAIDPKSVLDDKSRLARIEIAILALIMIPTLRGDRYRKILKTCVLRGSADD